MADDLNVVDARGHQCPVPSLRLRKAMSSHQAGTRFCLLATDPMARIDVAYLMQETGGRVLGIQNHEDFLKITVEIGDAQPG